MTHEPAPVGGEFSSYADFARAIYETGVLSDPWLDGVERFRLGGVVLTEATARDLYRVAERVAYLHQELIRILIERPQLVEEFYPLTPYQQAMWESSGGLWHGMARADLFVLEDGKIVCCELNSDTPSGQPEAVFLNQMLYARNAAACPPLHDPNGCLKEAFLNMLRASHAKRTDARLRRAGIIYPTELTEDLAMITLLTRWMEEQGIRVVAGSPYNLRRTSKGLEVLGETVDLIVRHYKTDWWSERAPVWADAPDYPDAEPLSDQLGALLSAEMSDEVTVVNPFGSVVTQNKLSLAFFWEHKELFSAESRSWIGEHIPETRRMSGMSREQLLDEKDAWVLKSDYGCEGAETVCGAFVTEEIWRRAIETALPEHFVAQKFFRAAPEAGGWLPNYGVYLFGGAANGIFTRLSKGSTQVSSVTAPTYVAIEDSRRSR